MHIYLYVQIGTVSVGLPMPAWRETGADRSVVACWLASPACGLDAIGADGIDALERMPLTVLTASPRLRLRGVEPAGADTIATFERV